MRGIEKGEQPVGGTVRTHAFFYNGLERALYLELLRERRGDWLPSKPEGEGPGSVSELPEAEFHLFHPGLAELASQTQKTGLWERKWVGSYSGQWFFWDHPVPQPVFSPQAHCPGPGFYPQGPGTAADKAFNVVNEAEMDIFLEFSCFFYDPTDIGNLTEAPREVP